SRAGHPRDAHHGLRRLHAGQHAGEPARAFSPVRQAAATCRTRGDTDLRPRLDTLRLGLIGDNIAASRAPDLHHTAARICGVDLAYERLVPRDLGLDF